MSPSRGNRRPEQACPLISYRQDAEKQHLPNHAVLMTGDSKNGINFAY